MAKSKPLPSVEFLRECFEYDAARGLLIWRRGPARGKIAGSPKDGYLQACLMINGNRQRVYVHRVIWAFEYGSINPIEIDHEDGNGGNNKISNLREVTHAENNRNARLSKKNKSGVPGVQKEGRKWSARIGKNSDPRSYIGKFSTFDAAVAARKAAELARGYHPNHGRIAKPL